ncbi:hypothetical protein GCM10028791_28280 [Echinicola sediminis]
MLLAAPIAIGIIMLLATKPHNSTNKTIMEPIAPVTSLQQDDNYLEEYERLIKEGTTDKKELRISRLNIDRLRQLWDLMSEDQRKKANKIPAVPALPIPDKMKVTQEQLDEIIHGDKIGVWLDGKQVSRDKIAQLLPEEITYYHKSRILKNAKNYGVFDFEITLMTNDSYYQNFIIQKTLLDQKSVYSKAIEIFKKHQDNPQLYKGKLGGDINVLFQIYERIPQWEKEKYNIKNPTEALKNQNNKQTGFNYLPFFKQEEKC